MTARTARRFLGCVSAVCAVQASIGSARAQNVKEICAAAYDQSQELRDQKQLVLARAQLLVCESACPAVLARDCVRWRADVDARLPTIVPSARDQGGRAIADVEVRIDGKSSADLHAGKEAQIEAGSHKLSFERADGSSIDVETTLKEGDRSVPVVAVFPGGAGPHDPPAAGAPGGRDSTADGPGPLPFVLGGVGLAALGVGGVLAIKGHLDRGALYDCRPRCSQDDVDAVATTWTVAGVVAGVGAAAVGVAVLLWISADEPVRKASMSAPTLVPRGSPLALRWAF